MIKKLKVKNFKSLKDFECDFTEPISVLAGPNMSGKSNSVDALNFITDSIGIGYQSAVQKRNGYLEIKWKGNKIQKHDQGTRSENISFSIEGDIYLSNHKKSFDYSYYFELSGDNYGYVSLQNEELEIGGEIIITNSQGNAKIKNELGGNFQVNIFSNELALNIVNASNGIAYEAKLSLSYIYFYSLEPSPMKNTQNPSSSAQFLLKDGGNLSSWIMTLQTKYKDNFEKLISAIRNILPDIKDIFANITQTSSVFLSSKENNIYGDINLLNMSDGEIKIIALLSLIFAPPELTPGFVVVEEPENYLHPGVLKNIIEYLRDVRSDAEKKIGNNTEKDIYIKLSQILITTHSLVLIDNFNIEELIIVKKEGGATSVAYPKGEEDMKKLIEDKEIGLGSLYFSGALK